MGEPGLLKAELIYPMDAGGTKVDGHAHDCHEAVVVFQGPYTVTVDGRRHRGDAGMVFVHPAGQWHDFETAVQAQVVIGVLQWRGPDPGFHVFHDPAGRWLVGMRWMAELVDGRRDAAARHLAQGLLLALLDDLAQGHGAEPVDAVARVHKYLRWNVHRKVTLRELADLAHCTPQYLTRIFRAAYGQPPMQFLQGLRVDLARSLAQTTSLGIDEIASRCGCCDASHLGRLLRRTLGCGLRDLRRSVSGADDGASG